MFLKYPLLVKDRDSFFEQAIKFNITLGDWFLSPLHPIKNDLERWGFVSTYYPIASMISKKVVNLPTDISDNSDVIKFLERELDLIE
jgi:hypothetical protein